MVDLHELIADVASKKISVDVAIATLKTSFTESGINQVSRMEGATIDLGRRQRCGFAEVIYGEQKSCDLITRIIQTQRDAGQLSLVTRIDDRAATRLSQLFPESVYNSIARTFRTLNCSDHPELASGNTSSYRAAVVTAGSTDAPVAEEAMETLKWMGVRFDRFDDIGVAGPQRLLAAVPQLRQASAVVVIAGMEGALPAAIAGHLSCPIFAVPTSVGYGATLGGLTPMLGMLSSCASNVAVVNIDAGFKGGYLAGIVVHQLLRSVRNSV